MTVDEGMNYLSSSTQRMNLDNEMDIDNEDNEDMLLPSELWVQVFDRLDWRTLVRCRNVCRAFYDIISSAVNLEYNVELGANGLRDSTCHPFPTLAVATKLGLLLQQKQNWRSLEWRKREWVSIPGPCFAYELVGGWFAKCRALPPVIGEHGDVIGGSREFIFCRLPKPSLTLPVDIGTGGTSDLDGVGGQEMKAIVRRDIGIPCRDFNFDPTQDLLALIEEPAWYPNAVLKVHLRTLSTNQYHPLASQSVITYRTLEPYDSVVIQILDDIIAIFFRVRNLPRVLIWDWTKGDLLVDMFKFSDQVLFTDFSLLSPYAFMLTMLYPSTLNIFAFRSPPHSKLSNKPLRSISPSPSTKAHTPLLRLHLPNCHAGFQYDAITTHTPPFTKYVPEEKMFDMHDEARMHVMSLTVGKVIRRGQDANNDNENDDGNPNGMDIAPEMVIPGEFPVEAPNLGVQHAPAAGAQAEPNEPHTTYYILVVFNRTLLKYLDDALEVESTKSGAFNEEERYFRTGADFLYLDAAIHGLRHGKSRTPKVIRWEDWGPKNTRVWAERLGRTWLRYTHGPRFVRTIHTRWPSTKCKLLIRDFSVHPLRGGDNDGHTEARDAAEPHSKCVHRYVDWGTRISRYSPLSGSEEAMARVGGGGAYNGYLRRVNDTDDYMDLDMMGGSTSGSNKQKLKQFFEHDIVSFLPYREVVSKEEFNFSGFMIDDERVIGLSTLAFAEGDMRGLEVFTF